MEFPIDSLQPEEYALSQRKLARIRWKHHKGILMPFPRVIEVPSKNRKTIIDGNHRTYVWYERGNSCIEVDYQGKRVSDLAEGVIARGITKISDLADNILSQEDWLRIYPCPACSQDALPDEEFFILYPGVRDFMR